MQWYLKAIKNYAVFEGRARRTEYWMFYLVNVIIVFALLFLETVSGSNGFGVLLMLYYLFLIIPSLALTVRRLHDIGRNGWNILFGLIPFAGGIILLVFACLESEPDNRYGPNPKRSDGRHQIGMSTTMNHHANNENSNTSIPTPSVNTPTPAKIFCGNCGKKTAVANFCVHCGKELHM